MDELGLEDPPTQIKPGEKTFKRPHFYYENRRKTSKTENSSNKISRTLTYNTEGITFGKYILQYSVVHYSTVQYSTVQYSIVKYCTVQYITVQYSRVE